MSRSLHFAAALAAAILGAAPAAATLQGGLTALERFDYESALREFRDAAEAGDAEAQYQLGLLYYVGHGGIPQDYALAAQWFGRAAERGHAEAQMRLGDLHAKGQGVPQDYDKARQLLRAALPRLRDAERRYAESYAVRIDEFLQARVSQPAGAASGGPAREARPQGQTAPGGRAR